MSTHVALPETDTPVEMTTSDGPIGGIRVEEINGDLLTLTTPNVARPPEAGDAAVLRWSAGRRGRYALPTVVVTAGVAAGRMVVKISGETQVEQLRQFVRGGGGEKIWIRRFESGEARETDGFVQDMSERGLRARFIGLRTEIGEAVWIRMDLDGETVELETTVLKIRRTESGTDVVFVFEADEAVAQIIRRYVLRLQMLARAKTAADE